MDESQLRTLLEGWQRGERTYAQIEQALSAAYAPTAELSQVRLDLDRVRRCGFPEVVYGAGKSLEQLMEIISLQRRLGQPSLITRCVTEHAQELLQTFPDAVVNSAARTFRVGQMTATGEPRVVVVTAGATDRPVAQEAVETVRWMGCAVTEIDDIGVAGPWRLLEKRLELGQGDVVVVVAGMEGALPSVVGGWVRCPVISVPTSVGYGANLSGLAPLLSMLNSCAANVAVVNIDSGFKGGYVAGLIATQTAAARTRAASTL